MTASSYAPFPGAIRELDANLSTLLRSTVQPTEGLLLGSQTNVDEGIVVTRSRVIILKGPTRSTSGKPSCRFYLLSAITGIRVLSFMGAPNFIGILTEQSKNTVIPLMNRWRCDFGVTFDRSSLCREVGDYVNGLVNLLNEDRRQALLSAPLQPIRPTTTIVLQQSEEFYFECPAVSYAEHSYTAYQGGTQGVSLRIMRGVSYRIGGYRGQGQRHEKLEVDDNGTLLVGSKRVLFVGKRKSIEVPNAKITSVEVFSNGLRIDIANKKSMQFETSSEMAGTVLCRVLGIA